MKKTLILICVFIVTSTELRLNTLTVVNQEEKTWNN